MSEHYISVNLPSKCKTYEGVDPKGIAIRTLKGKDEKIIAEMTTSNFEKKLLEVFKNVVKGIDPSRLTTGDASYLMVWLAINSYSDEFGIELVCKECIQKIRVVIKLSQLEVKELPDDFEQPYVIELSDGKKLSLRLLTIEDEIAAVEYESKGKNAYLYRLALSIVDKDMDIVQKERFLEDLDVKDLAKIKEFHDKFYHGPSFLTSYICPKCGAEGKVTVPFRF